MLRKSPVTVFSHAPTVCSLRSDLYIPATMRWRSAAGVIGVVSALSCSSQEPAREHTAAASSAIQGGTDDSTHTFVVGIYNQQYQAVCSGALLAPNLVATARHCVALTTQQIDCSTSTFPTPVAASQMAVTTDANMSANTWVFVAKIIVPSQADQDKVCGNDLALLILDKNVTLPEYVTPTITPPMTDPSYTQTVTAIGYGVDAPNDTMSAGQRRIKENIGLNCIPNDKTFTDCFADPTAKTYMTANEFISGDGTCEGDSGSSAFEQKNFDSGNWVSFGVLSRGGVSSDGTTCVGGLYTRFDAWGPLIIEAATEAAQRGGYTVPTWAQAPGGDDGGAGDGGTGDDGGGSLQNGTACGTDSDCASNDCFTHDDGGTFTCVPCDNSSPCNTGLTCNGGVCVKPSTGGQQKAHGCAVAPEPSDRVPWRWLALTLGVGAAALSRRRRRRA
jgi:MYXO-CTERM domain-containing protein